MAGEFFIPERGAISSIEREAVRKKKEDLRKGLKSHQDVFNKEVSGSGKILANAYTDCPSSRGVVDKYKGEISGDLTSVAEKGRSALKKENPSEELAGIDTLAGRLKGQTENVKNFVPFFNDLQKSIDLTKKAGPAMQQLRTLWPDRDKHPRNSREGRQFLDALNSANAAVGEASLPTSGYNMEIFPPEILTVFATSIAPLKEYEAELGGYQMDMMTNELAESPDVDPETKKLKNAKTLFDKAQEKVEAVAASVDKLKNKEAVRLTQLNLQVSSALKALSETSKGLAAVDNTKIFQNLLSLYQSMGTKVDLQIQEMADIRLYVKNSDLIESGLTEEEKKCVRMTPDGEVRTTAEFEGLSEQAQQSLLAKFEGVKTDVVMELDEKLLPEREKLFQQGQQKLTSGDIFGAKADLLAYYKAESGKDDANKNHVEGARAMLKEIAKAELNQMATRLDSMRESVKSRFQNVPTAKTDFGTYTFQQAEMHIQHMANVLDKAAEMIENGDVLTVGEASQKLFDMAKELEKGGQNREDEAAVTEEQFALRDKTSDQLKEEMEKQKENARKAIASRKSALENWGSGRSLSEAAGATKEEVQRYLEEEEKRLKDLDTMSPDDFRKEKEIGLEERLREAKIRHSLKVWYHGFEISASENAPEIFDMFRQQAKLNVADPAQRRANILEEAKLARERGLTGVARNLYELYFEKELGDGAAGVDREQVRKDFLADGKNRSRIEESMKACAAEFEKTQGRRPDEKEDAAMRGKLTEAMVNETYSKKVKLATHQKMMAGSGTDAEIWKDVYGATIALDDFGQGGLAATWTDEEWNSKVSMYLVEIVTFAVTLGMSMAVVKGVEAGAGFVAKRLIARKIISAATWKALNSTARGKILLWAASTGVEGAAFAHAQGVVSGIVNGDWSMFESPGAYFKALGHSVAVMGVLKGVGMGIGKIQQGLANRALGRVMEAGVPLETAVLSEQAVASGTAIRFLKTQGAFSKGGWWVARTTIDTAGLLGTDASMAWISGHDYTSKDLLRGAVSNVILSSASGAVHSFGGPRGEGKSLRGKTAPDIRAEEAIKKAARKGVVADKAAKEALRAAKKVKAAGETGEGNAPRAEGEPAPKPPPSLIKEAEKTQKKADEKAREAKEADTAAQQALRESYLPDALQSGPGALASNYLSKFTDKVPKELWPDGDPKRADEVPAWIDKNGVIQYNLNYLNKQYVKVPPVKGAPYRQPVPQKVIPEGYTAKAAETDLIIQNRNPDGSPKGRPVRLAPGDIFIEGPNGEKYSVNAFRQLPEGKLLVTALRHGAVLRQAGIHERAHRRNHLALTRPEVVKEGPDKGKTVRVEDKEKTAPLLELFAKPDAEGKIPEGKIKLTDAQGKPVEASLKNIEEYLSRVEDGSARVTPEQRKALEAAMKKAIPGFRFGQVRNADTRALAVNKPEAVKREEIAAMEPVKKYEENAPLTEERIMEGSVPEGKKVILTGGKKQDGIAGTAEYTVEKVSKGFWDVKYRIRSSRNQSVETIPATEFWTRLHEASGRPVSGIREAARTPAAAPIEPAAARKAPGVSVRKEPAAAPGKRPVAEREPDFSDPKQRKAFSSARFNRTVVRVVSAVEQNPKIRFPHEIKEGSAYANLERPLPKEEVTGTIEKIKELQKKIGGTYDGGANFYFSGSAESGAGAVNRKVYISPPFEKIPAFLERLFAVLKAKNIKYMNPKVHIEDLEYDREGNLASQKQNTVCFYFKDDVEFGKFAESVRQVESETGIDLLQYPDAGDLYGQVHDGKINFGLDMPGGHGSYDVWSGDFGHKLIQFSAEGMRQNLRGEDLRRFVAQKAEEYLMKKYGRNADSYFELGINASTIIQDINWFRYHEAGGMNSFELYMSLMEKNPSRIASLRNKFYSPQQIFTLDYQPGWTAGDYVIFLELCEKIGNMEGYTLRNPSSNWGEFLSPENVDPQTFEIRIPLRKIAPVADPWADSRKPSVAAGSPAGAETGAGAAPDMEVRAQPGQKTDLLKPKIRLTPKQVAGTEPVTAAQQPPIQQVDLVKPKIRLVPKSAAPQQPLQQADLVKPKIRLTPKSTAPAQSAAQQPQIQQVNLVKPKIQLTPKPATPAQTAAPQAPIQRTPPVKPAYTPVAQPAAAQQPLQQVDLVKTKIQLTPKPATPAQTAAPQAPIQRTPPVKPAYAPVAQPAAAQETGAPRYQVGQKIGIYFVVAADPVKDTYSISKEEPRQSRPAHEKKFAGEKNSPVFHLGEKQMDYFLAHQGQLSVDNLAALSFERLEQKLGSGGQTARAQKRSAQSALRENREIDDTLRDIQTKSGAGAYKKIVEASLGTIREQGRFNPDIPMHRALRSLAERDPKGYQFLESNVEAMNPSQIDSIMLDQKVDFVDVNGRQVRSYKLGHMGSGSEASVEKVMFFIGNDPQMQIGAMRHYLPLPTNRQKQYVETLARKRAMDEQLRRSRLATELGHPFINKPLVTSETYTIFETGEDIKHVASFSRDRLSAEHDAGETTRLMGEYLKGYREAFQQNGLIHGDGHAENLITYVTPEGKRILQTIDYDMKSLKDANLQQKIYYVAEDYRRFNNNTGYFLEYLEGKIPKDLYDRLDTARKQFPTTTEPVKGICDVALYNELANLNKQLETSPYDPALLARKRQVEVMLEPQFQAGHARVKALLDQTISIADEIATSLK
jgi:hypothetical protein